MENLFSNIFFACFVIKNKKKFVSKSGSQHHSAELGCQQMFLELMTKYRSASFWAGSSLGG